MPTHRMYVPLRNYKPSRRPSASRQIPASLPLSRQESKHRPWLKSRSPSMRASVYPPSAFLVAALVLSILSPEACSSFQSAQLPSSLVALCEHDPSSYRVWSVELELSVFDESLATSPRANVRTGYMRYLKCFCSACKPRSSHLYRDQFPTPFLRFPPFSVLPFTGDIPRRCSTSSDHRKRL